MAAIPGAGEACSKKDQANIAVAPVGDSITTIPRDTTGIAHSGSQANSVDSTTQSGGESEKGDSTRASSEADDVRGTYNERIRMVNLAITDIGYGRYQWLLFTCAAFGWLVDNMMIQGLAISLPFLPREFVKSEQEARQATLALTVGMIGGAFFWSTMSDRKFGRRPAYLWTILPSGVAIIAASCWHKWAGLCVFLALAGVGIGGNLPVDGVFFMEFVPPSETTKLILLGNAWAWGYFLVNLLAYGTLKSLSCEPSSMICAANGDQQPCCGIKTNFGWRLVLGISGLLAIIVATVRNLAFPAFESPKYLVGKGKLAEAARVLQQVAEYNGKDCWLTEEILREARGEAGAENTDADAGCCNLWKTLGMESIVSWLRQDARLLRSTLALLAAFPAVGLAYPLFCAFLPQFFRSVAGGPNGIPDELLLRDSLITAATTLPAAPFAYSLAGTRCGRRWTLTTSTAFSGVILFIFAFHANEASATAYTSLTLFCQNAMYCVLYAYVPERVPAPIRASITGYLSGFNRIAGLSAPIIATYARGVDDKAFVCISAALFLFAAAVFLFITETRGVQSL